MATKIREMERYVEAVLRALDLLDCFQSQPALRLKDLTALTRMTRSRVIRLVGTLESRGYLLHDGEKGLFRLGPRLLTLGKAYETNNSLTSAARPILRELVQKTGELASLYVLDRLERVALARERGTHEISYSVTEGQRMELYAGAAGKVLLAFAPREVQAKVLKRKRLKRLTSHTVVEPGVLIRELETIRRKGFAWSEGERVADVWSVAAPVFDHTQNVCCSVGITGPLYRLPKQVQLRFTEILIDQAKKLSNRLGWKEP